MSRHWENGQDGKQAWTGCLRARFKVTRSAPLLLHPAMPRSILIVTNRAPWPLRDGGAMAMHQIILGYKRQGWAVHLLTMNTRRHWVEEVELRAAYASLDSITIVAFDNRLRPVRLVQNLLLSRQPEHAERFYNAAFEKAVVDTVQRVRPDVVQMESPFLTGYLPGIRANSRAAFVLRMHNVEHQIWHRAAREAKGAKRLYLHSLARRMRRYEQWAWSLYELLLPITPDDAKAVRDAGCSTPQHLIPFGIETNAVSGRIVQRYFNAPLKLYHLGAMDWIPNREGVAWFIRDVWPQIHAVQPSAEFHFGGRLLEKAFAAPLPTGVFNHGVVDDAASFALGMDILVVPLHAGGGIRIKILEAMAAGKIVVSTGVGIQGIAGKDGVHFLRADTPADFAEAIRKIATDPELALRIADAGQTLVRNDYDAQQLATRLSERLHSLLEERQ